MEANGVDDLKEPLLQCSNSVAITIPDSDHKKNEKISTIMFRVRGIECASCATSIESALGKLNGVRSVMVSPLQGQAVIKYVPELINVRFLFELYITLCYNKTWKNPFSHSVRNETKFVFLAYYFS